MSKKDAPCNKQETSLNHPDYIKDIIIIAPAMELIKERTNPIEEQIIPAIAMPLPPFFIPTAPMIIPTMVTGYPNNGMIHAIKLQIPNTKEAIDCPFFSCGATGAP